MRGRAQLCANTTRIPATATVISQAYNTSIWIAAAVADVDYNRSRTKRLRPRYGIVLKLRRGTLSERSLGGQPDLFSPPAGRRHLGANASPTGPSVPPQKPG
jgi:hypothetical protein